MVVRNAAELAPRPPDALPEDDADDVEEAVETLLEELEPPDRRPAPVLTELEIRPEPRCPPWSWGAMRPA